VHGLTDYHPTAADTNTALCVRWRQRLLSELGLARVEISDYEMVVQVDERFVRVVHSHNNESVHSISQTACFVRIHGVETNGEYKKEHALYCARTGATACAHARMFGAHRQTTTTLLGTAQLRDRRRTSTPADE
jgi:hypothetical protein